MSARTPPTKLLNRDFVLLWQGQLVSQFGNQAFLVASMFWTMQVTGSASLMGVLMTLSALPAVVLGPIGGTFADWYPRRAIIVWSDVLSGLAVLALAALFLLHAAQPVLIAVLLAAVVVLGVIKAFFQPAIAAALPDLVPADQLAAANSMSQFSTQASGVVGQGLGGILYSLLGAPVLFLVDGLSYLVSAISEAFIHIPHRERVVAGSAREAMAAFRRDTAEGLRWVWQRVGMRNLLLAAAVLNFVMMPVFVLLPFYVERTLGRGAAWYGFLLAALSVGAITGYVLSGAVRVTGRTRGRVLVGSFVAVGGVTGALGFVHHAPVALALVFVVGVMSGIINIHIATLLQSRTPGGIRGRVMSLVMAIATAATPLGMMLGGVLGDLTGKNVPLIYGACGVAAVVFIGAAAANREFREFLAGD
jgi:MFS family permease